MTLRSQDEIKCLETMRRSSRFKLPRYILLNTPVKNGLMATGVTLLWSSFSPTFTLNPQQPWAI